MKVYYQILIRLGFSGRKQLLGSIFQEDNDPQHGSKFSRGYLNEKNKTGWCVSFNQSLDLNPTELIWDHLDTKLRKMCNTSNNVLWQNSQRACTHARYWITSVQKRRFNPREIGLTLLYGKRDHFEILDHPRHVLHSLSLPAAMPSGMGEGQMVKKGPKLQSSFPTA
ncbi:hypothetical protein OUZ56_009784 [Daphnia magna]|uniref:Uncharacterized protein n=1 Tax=Daphnia magna TaxID=35525 RepID=A0ABR0AGV7_9CRUS|nr:hypothetical protein OUZ56_009784 [Daphnia magna]